MKYRVCMIAVAALTMMWGCTGNQETIYIMPEPTTTEPQGEYSVFTESDDPGWDINWKWLNATPDWQEPEANKYPYSMQIHVVLDEGLASYSTDADMMAVFMGGTCRGVSQRNVLEKDGSVVFLMNIEGDENEIGKDMELRYFNAKLTHIFVNRQVPPFEPDNLWGEKYNLVQVIGMGSAKYPYTTKLEVVLPTSLPFTAHSDDCVYVFVKDECRGVFNTKSGNAFSGYVFSHNEGETAEIRYYSVNKHGYYTINETITLNNGEQTVNIKF